MILTDSHMHTAFSSDSDTPMETMIQEAIEKGLTSICITDHHDIDYPYHIENFDFQTKNSLQHSLLSFSFRILVVIFNNGIGNLFADVLEHDLCAVHVGCKRNILYVAKA